jgi:HSP20 family protein
MNAIKIRTWGPQATFAPLRGTMDRMLLDAFPGFPQRAGLEPGALRPAADAYETEDEVVIELALPGIDPAAVEVTFEADSLTVTGDLPARDADRQWVLAERPQGRFHRRFTLNTPVDPDGVTASYAGGVLSLTLKKSEAEKPRKIQVNVG